MGNGMNKVLPGLFIGNFKDARDVEQLHKNKVTHILSIHDGARPMLEGMKYLCIPASDSPSQNLIQHFKDSTSFIHECRLKGEGCLVHCLAGVSRSVTLVVAYIMTVTNLKWEEALAAVKGARTCANPNMGFQRQLEEFGKHDAQHMCCPLIMIIYFRRVCCNSESEVEKHRKWLKETYGENPFPDEEEVKQLIAKYKQEEELSAGSSSRQWNSHLTPLSSMAFRNYTTET